MKRVCKNHSETSTDCKCDCCDDLICEQCQIKIMNKVFCSYKCLAGYMLSEAKKTFGQIKKYMLDEKRLNFSNVINAALLFGLMISIIFGINNLQKINEIRNSLNVEADSAPVVPVDSVAHTLDTLKVLTPQPGSMVMRNNFTIEGETEPNRIVTVSSNGKLIEAQVVKGSTFKFTDITARPGKNQFVVRSFNEDGSSVLLEEINFTYGVPTRSFLARDFVRGSIDEKKIALTFDGGYLDNATPDILDILNQESVKATMFLTGIYLRKYPELVKRMLADGHEIGNHTWTHPHLTSFAENRRHNTLENINREVIRQELLRVAELFKHITGQKMASLWRAPYGEHNADIRSWAAEAGFRHVGWTLGKNWEDGMDTLDWVADKNSSAYHSADEIVQKILSYGNGSKYGANGTIVLMHLGTLRTDDYPHLKLPMIINEMRKKGYEFVTISEMM